MGYRIAILPVSAGQILLNCCALTSAMDPEKPRSTTTLRG
jgi:hypothetical protein